MNAEEQLRALFDAFIAAKKERCSAQARLARTKSEIADQEKSLLLANTKFDETKRALDEALGNEALERNETTP